MSVTQLCRCERIWDYHSDCVVPTLKHGGGRELVSGCMSAKGAEKTMFIDANMHATLYTHVLNEKMTSSLEAWQVRKFPKDPKQLANLNRHCCFLKNYTNKII
uniref:Uncharacterized protein n=1 Tax=Monopterus albus TaxID=43700 RepID=A0A3Q3JYV3_MONAL